MELTIESALSPGGMVGNASYVLLIASMAMRDMFWLRVLAILSGLFGITYDFVWLRDPIGVFWEGLFTATNVAQWAWLVYEKRSLRLTPDEQELRDAFFPALPDLEFKQLAAATERQQLPPGSRLTTQGEPVPDLYMIVDGSVDVELDGKVVSSCRPGDYVGEISYLSRLPASATTTAATSVDVIRLSKESLASLMRSSKSLGRLINATLSENVSNKLINQSRLPRSDPTTG